ncbi:MAG: hypothetical protein B6D44_01760 [Ignavibacteriales bacterium UTCHB2]|jgi:hypothetical protein|nr:MAG: hypothetical protein BWY38_00689 [Ignavibacteria bacterium ADurb.Bin266]OQY75290.1 MAG: hypothetical protein B6D44_01760 [Ignavibacteriales bacterium UTCHB2]HQI42142.1 hypothetical protein [Ignavibacteriaceae bacterium]
MTQNKIEFQRYRDFGQIINSTFEFIRQNFLPLLKSLIFITGPFLLITGLLLGFYQKSIFTLFQITSLSQTGLIILLLIVSIFLTMQMLLSTVYSFILIYLSKEDYTQISIEEVWDGVKQIFFKILGLTLALIFLIAAAFFILVLFIGLTANATQNPFLGMLIFLLLFIPILFFIVKLSFVYIVALYERTGFWESIQRSFYLIRNKWWFTFGLIFVLGVIQGLMGVIFQIPQYIITFATMFNSLDGSGVSGVTEILIMITSVISAFQYLLSSITIIALAFLYFSLVELKEAKGLMEKIESIN